MLRAIIFDVDGVITNSGQNKEDIIQQILTRHNLFDIAWVRDIFWKWLNRIVLLDMIYQIYAFDKQLVLSEINRELLIQESRVVLIPETIKFIKKYYKEYNFFTNTSLPKSSLNTIVQNLDIWKYFLELLAYDDGSKKENIEYVMKVHNAKPQDILFIDDKQTHLDAVKDTGVNTLLFINDGVSLEEKISDFLK